MPDFIKDDSKWESAKEAARKQGKERDFAYIMGIYKNMGGETKTHERKKIAPMIAKQNKKALFKSDIAAWAANLLIKAQGSDKVVLVLRKKSA